MNIPEWTPENIRPVLADLDKDSQMTGERRRLFERILTDPKMRDVYDELLSRNRDTGDFFYLATTPNDGSNSVEVQLSAIRDLITTTIEAALQPVGTSRPDEIEKQRADSLQAAANLNKVADDLRPIIEKGLFGISAEQQHQLIGDLAAVRRVAAFIEAITAGLHRPDSRFSVQRHRQDSLDQGMQIYVSSKLKELFGFPLKGTAINLATVVLGRNTSRPVA